MPDSARRITFWTWLALAFALALPLGAVAQDEAIDVPLPPKAPVIPDLPDRNPVLENVQADELEEREKLTREQKEEEAEEAEIESENHIVKETDDEEEASSKATETTAPPPLPSRKPPRRKGRVRSAEPMGPAPLQQWSDQEIAEAKVQCKNLLAGAAFEFEALAPIRKGVCGTPAPIELSSVNAGQTVTIRPAAKLNCNMASQFRRWMEEVVQPSAKTHLETEITGVINIASYHCRTRYNDPGQRISQHAFANALDVAGFITAKGEQIDVEKFWEGDTPQSRFLREIHDGACKIFGTVLGPEANAAHRNHFHLDMTKRRHGSYCQ